MSILKEYFHKGLKKKDFLSKGVKHPLKISQIVTPLYISLISRGISPAFAIMGLMWWPTLETQVIVVPSRNFNPWFMGLTFIRKLYFYPSLPTHPHFLPFLFRNFPFSPQTLNLNFTFLLKKLTCTMLIISFYTGGFIQNGPHGVHYSKKFTGNFMVHTDITHAELEAEIYRWMGILSSTHGLEISARFNAGLQLTPQVMFYTEL
jgi:hypothetical protein